MNPGVSVYAYVCVYWGASVRIWVRVWVFQCGCMCLCVCGFV